MTRGKALWKWISLGAITLFVLLGAGALSGQEHVFAAKNIASGSYGNTTWVIDKNGKLTVTGTGNVGRMDYELDNGKYIQVPEWHPYYEKIKTAEINVTGMTDASYLFYECAYLEVVDLSRFDTSKVTDMSWMFDICMNLAKLDISGFDTSKVTNMSGMFWGCNSLTKLDVSNFNTSNVTDMSWMFYGCGGLNKLDVSNFDTSKVIDMSDMFGQCYGLTKLDVGNFDTAKVTDMNYMFWGCTGLTKLDTSNFDTSNVINMRGMFSGCTGLTKLDTSNFDTSNVIDMSEMFSECRNLNELDVSNYNTSNVTYMSYMFYSCSSLTSLDMSSFDMQSVADYDGDWGAGFFLLESCSSLTTIYAPYNVGGEIELPSSGDTWYLSDGTVVTAIPQNLSSSVAIGKNHVPTEKKSVSKTKLTTKNTTIKLSKKSYTYDGKAKKPTVKVYNFKSKVLKSKYYTVTYKNNTKVGKATLTIKFKGKYTGTIKATYTIKPKATALTGTSAKTNRVTLTWKKQTKQVTGYQIQYATDSKFTKNKTTVLVKGAKKSSETITGLSGKTTYYFRIRTYKTVDGKKYCSAWSKAQAVKTK